MIIFLLVFAIIRTHAAPLSAGPATDPTIAHTYLFGVEPRAAGSEASMRTLYDVAKSCFITVAACVYRAIHQNIPDPSLGFWGRLRVRVKITIYALIAPELMILWALRQRVGAKKIVEVINEAIPGLEWTLTHGQFIQMGGLVQNDNKHVLKDTNIVHLFRKGRLELKELSQVTKADIDDKSKGDILSKGLVALQTTWFVFECMARLQQRLPLLELEVVTLAFATLNIITYALWWHKPLDVLRPISLHIVPFAFDKVEPRPSFDIDTIGQEPETEPLVAQVPDPHSTPTLATPKAGIVARAWAEMGRLLDNIKYDIGKRPWYMTIWKRLIKNPLAAVLLPLPELMGDTPDIDKTVPGSVDMFSGAEISKLGHLGISVSSLIGVIFGAIHFISWNATFPTSTQMLLWRASSVVLVVEPGFVLFGYLFVMILIGTIELWVKIDGWFEMRWLRYLGGCVGGAFAALGEIIDTLSRIKLLNTLFEGLFVGLGSMLVIAVPILYILSRFCLLVIAFLTLRDLPPHSLDTISWTSYIPHI